MEYLTYYEVGVVNTKTNEAVSEEILKEMGTYLATHSEWFEPNDADVLPAMLEMDSMTWYDWEHDMGELSHQYPDYGFTLSGIGEDVDDRWMAYIKDGCVQFEECQFVYGPNKLW